MDRHLKGYVYVVLSLLLTSLSFILMTIAVRNVGVTNGAFFLFVVAMATSTAILLVTRNVRESFVLVRKHWRPVIAIGALNAISLFLWLYSLQLIGPSLTAFLGRFGTIFTILMGVIFLKERFNKLELVGAAIMIAGAFVLSYNGGDFIIFGVILVLILSLTFSTWQFLTKIYIKHINPIVMNHIRITVTFIILLIYVGLTRNIEVPSMNILGIIALGSIAGGIIGFILAYKAMELTDLSKISTIQSLEPFVVMLYAYVILGGIPTGYQLLGGLVIVAGVLLLVMARYKPKFIERFVE